MKKMILDTIYIFPGITGLELNEVLGKPSLIEMHKELQDLEADNYIHRIGKDKASYFHWHYAQTELDAQNEAPV